jgi:hypothetical protein
MTNVTFVLTLDERDNQLLNDAVGFLANLQLWARRIPGLKADYCIQEIPPRTISDELRDKMLNDAHFLKDFALNCFMGDGLEYDHAADLLGQVSDDELCDEYAVNGCRRDIAEELQKLGKWQEDLPEKAEEVEDGKKEEN